jgi:hypothetical protein
VRKIEVFSKRLSVQKSPKGAAGLAQQVRKIEVFFKRLSVQKSPKGAAGLAQQVRKIEVFLKRLSVQKSPKGAAGLAQQVRKIEVFLKRLSAQKSPKGAAGLAQQMRKTEVFLKRLSVQKSTPRNCPRKKTDHRRSQTDIINVLDQVRNAPMDIAGCAKAHNLIIQTIVTYVQRGHHTLHWFNLRNDSHLPIVKQHYPKLLTLKRPRNSPSPTLAPTGEDSNSRLPALPTRSRSPSTSLTLRFATVLRRLRPALGPGKTSASVTCGEASAAATSKAAK